MALYKIFSILMMAEQIKAITLFWFSPTDLSFEQFIFTKYLPCQYRKISAFVNIAKYLPCQYHKNICLVNITKYLPCQYHKISALPISQNICLVNITKYLPCQYRKISALSISQNIGLVICLVRIAKYLPCQYRKISVLSNNYIEGSGSATKKNVAHPKHPEEEET